MAVEITTQQPIVQVADLRPAVTIVDQSAIVTTTQTVINTAVVGYTGPQGPKGDNGTPNITLTAGADLSGHTPVYCIAGVVYPMSHDQIGHVNRCIGITTGAALTGQDIIVNPGGELTGYVGLTPNEPIYVGLNGVLTQLPPATGFIQQIGVALTATSLNVQIQPAIWQ